MSRSPTPQPEVLLPAVALATLARLSRDGQEGLVEALNQSGEETGKVLHAGLTGGAAAEGAASFWHQFDGLLRRRGLGSLTHRRLHAGIGLLHVSGGPESAPSLAGERAPETAAETTCPFTTGVLRGILSAVAGRQVDLRPLVGNWEAHDGPEPGCRWIFGSTVALDQLNALLTSGQSLEDAVAHL